MALIKNLADLVKYWPIIQTVNFDNLKPFIVQAERDYIIPAIGQEQYDVLNEAYDTETPTLSTEQQKLLDKIQAAEAMYAQYFWIPSGQLQIGDSGIRIANTDTMKTAFPWQIDGLQRSVLRQAGSALDEMFSFLENNIEDYPLWAESDAFTQFADFFITTAKDFTKYYAPLNNSRASFMLLQSSMRAVEDFIIQAEISTDFYVELKSQKKENNLTEANKLVVTYLNKAIAPLSIHRALVGMSVTLDERGVLVFNNPSALSESNSVQYAPSNILDAIRRQTDNDGREYIKLLKQFLKDNIDDYPTYAESTAYDPDEGDNDIKNSSDNSFGILM